MARDLIRAYRMPLPRANIMGQIADRRERRERTARKLREPEFLDDLCEDVSEGATLHDLCKATDLTYRMVHEWIMGDADREEKYNTACLARAANLSDRVISGIIAVDDASIKDVLDDDGDVKAVSQIDDRVARALSGIEVVRDENGTTTKKIKMPDKLKALEMAGRNQKMFTDKVEHGGQVGLADLVTASMQPVKSE